MKRFFHDGGQDALRQAVRTVEQGSSAELVIAVEPAAGRYHAVDLAVGAVTAVVALAAALYVPFDLALHWILIDPIALGVAAAAVVRAVPAARRQLSRQATLEHNVVTRARACFVERGVHHTRAATGVLLYVAQLERRAAMVADSGVLSAVPPAAWREAEAAVDRAVASGRDARHLADVVTGLAPLLAEHLPRAADDRNELGDEVVA